MIILTALSLALIALAFAILLQARVGALRSRRLKGLNLEPNCLLTRHPLAFIAGPKSFFHRGSHWNEIPGFLREHGYDVLVVETPPVGDRARAVQVALDSLEGKAHLIADSSEAELLVTLARSRHPKIATLTQVKSGARARAEEALRTGLRPDDLRPLETAVDTLEIPAVETRGCLAFMSTLLLCAHNSLSRGAKIDAIETGVPITAPPWQNEICFLRHAISLAERDLQWSD